jgi:hypothetical protein
MRCAAWQELWFPRCVGRFCTSNPQCKLAGLARRRTSGSWPATVTKQAQDSHSGSCCALRLQQRQQQYASAPSAHAQTPNLASDPSNGDQGAIRLLAHLHGLCLLFLAAAPQAFTFASPPPPSRPSPPRLHSLRRRSRRRGRRRHRGAAPPPTPA